MIRGDLPGFPKLLATRSPQMASGLILHCCWMLRIFIIRLDDDKNEENYVLVMVSKSVMSVETMVVGIMMEEMILAKMFATSST